jgi:hypothetical protein
MNSVAWDDPIGITNRGLCDAESNPSCIDKGNQALSKMWTSNSQYSRRRLDQPSKSLPMAVEESQKLWSLTAEHF